MNSKQMVIRCRVGLIEALKQFHKGPLANTVRQLLAKAIGRPELADINLTGRPPHHSNNPFGRPKKKQ